jgi:hypothetical protein
MCPKCESNNYFFTKCNNGGMYKDAKGIFIQRLLSKFTCLKCGCKYDYKS